MFEALLELPYPIIVAIIGCVQTIIIALVAAFFSYRDKRREKQASLRADESRLSMRMTSAAVSLACAHAYAYKDGHVNGKMDAALTEAAAAQKEYFNFINSVASKQMAAN